MAAKGADALMESQRSDSDAESEAAETPRRPAHDEVQYSQKHFAHADEVVLRYSAP